MEMMNGLLINLLFILIFVLLTNMLLLHKNKFIQSSVWNYYFVFIACSQIVISLLLSVSVGHGFIYDLRFVPFLLGGLYGGKRVTIGLGLFLLAVRFVLGGDGFWLSLFLILISTIGIFVISPLYLKKSLWTKLSIVSAFSFVYAVIAYLMPGLLYGFNDFIAFIIYGIILVISTFFVTYLSEILRTTFVLQLEAMKFEKMEIVSHLAASISHEVRNPLTAVIGFLQLIGENEQTNEKSKTYAMYAIEEANRASGIINDYLTFAKPHLTEECLMNIDNAILKCNDILRPLTLKQNVEIETFFQHASAIKGDPHKFHQVLLNIFKNSIEAMPDGGILTIQTYENHNRIHIKITDTGHGMKPEHIARLGEPYFSLKGQKGTGLGMMVVYRIVESMKGIVTVTSEIDIGTSITLAFPIHDAKDSILR
ncbi:sensor histidine kinase [Cytobacillus massiliigabonensis]|uniref:sensor histidine kinase n=1 Tax=Cytobacillus massiliigabonensis TaxID=1871011 RepID=UPI000C85FEBF|nr:HAMP domain-containing sensor histidine kinase [Cytobacillus massiliigabonensis]